MNISVIIYNIKIVLKSINPHSHNSSNTNRLTILLQKYSNKGSNLKWNNNFLEEKHSMDMCLEYNRRRYGSRFVIPTYGYSLTWFALWSRENCLLSTVCSGYKVRGSFGPVHWFFDLEHTRLHLWLWIDSGFMCISFLWSDRSFL